MTRPKSLWHSDRAMTSISRRRFLHFGLAAGAGALAACTTSGRRASAAGDLRVAVIGLRSKGWSHVEHLRELTGVRIIALCDPDRDILDERLQAMDAAGLKCDGETDLRRLLERKDLDAVIIATPNHQHTLQAIWACQAGVHVYVEKPVAHNLFECRQIARAAAHYGCVVQAGTQGRSNTGLVPAMAYIHAGGLGKLKLARGFCYRPRPSIGKADGSQQLPPRLDYNLWCGPAPMEPLHRKSLHYDWHWNWTTGNGEIGNQGVHELDMCRWALGATDLPRRVFTLGGRFGYNDDGETPNTHVAWFDYAPAPIVFEVRGLPRKAGAEGMDAFRSIQVGVIIEGEDGYFAGGQTGGKIFDWNHKIVRRFPGDGGRNHMENFLNAVRAGRPAAVNAPVAEGALSAGLCHLANLAYRSGAHRDPDRIREQLPDRGDAAEVFDRVRTHLAANNVDLAKTPLTSGGWLEWDPDQYRFAGGPGFGKANNWIGRDYRAPFVVPERF